MAVSRAALAALALTLAACGHRGPGGPHGPGGPSPMVSETADAVDCRVKPYAAADGTIIGRRLTKSSGHKAWDDAVLRAIDRTDSLPRDIDGRVPSPIVIQFRPRD